MTWAEVAESQLGAECEIVPGVEKIIQFVRKSSLTRHVDWPDQARCDYASVTLWFFNRDYRAFHEKRLDANDVPAPKPSLLAIITEPANFMGYLRMALEWGDGMAARPQKQPYLSLLLSNAPPKGKRLALGVSAFEDDAGADAETPPSKRAKERKRQKERKREEEKKQKRQADERKPPADDRKPPKRQPGPGDKPAPHVGGGDKFGGQQGPRPQGSAWPNKKHIQAPGMVKVLQTKKDQSAGLDKGLCRAFSAAASAVRSTTASVAKGSAVIRTKVRATARYSTARTLRRLAASMRR